MAHDTGSEPAFRRKVIRVTIDWTLFTSFWSVDT